MKYRMHVKGHDIIVGTMVEGPALGLVHIVGGERVEFRYFDLANGFVPRTKEETLRSGWPHTEVPLGRWSWRRLFGETTEMIPKQTWRLLDNPVDIIVPVCDVKWAKEVK